MGNGHYHSRDGSLTGGLILIGIGTLFLLKKLGLFPGLDLGDLWPVILIIVGVALIVGYFRRVDPGTESGTAHHGGPPTPPNPPHPPESS